MVGCLVTQAQQGSDVAVAQLLRQSYPELLRCAKNLVRGDEIADDIVQEALLRVFQNLTRLRNPDAFYKWANQILRRCCLAYFREESRRRRFVRELEDHFLIEAPADPVAPEGARADLVEAIGTLGGKSRDVVNMHYFLGLSVREIAGAADVSVGAVKVRLHRARNALRESLTTD